MYSIMVLVNTFWRFPIYKQCTPQRHLWHTSKKNCKQDLIDCLTPPSRTWEKTFP